MGAIQQVLAAIAPSGGSGGATIWDLTTPTDYTSNTGLFTVSDGGQGMAQITTASDLTQKAVVSQSSGKYYFEVQYLSGGGTTLSVGVMSIAAACQNSDAVNGSAGHGDTTYRENGQCFSDGGNTFNGGGAGPWVANDVIGVAVDVGVDVKFYWANALQFTVTLTTADPTPMLSWSGGSLGSVLLRTQAADQTYSPPAGYSSWE